MFAYYYAGIFHSGQLTLYIMSNLHTMQISEITLYPASVDLVTNHISEQTTFLVVHCKYKWVEMTYFLIVLPESQTTNFLGRNNQERRWSF